LFYRLA